MNNYPWDFSQSSTAQSYAPIRRTPRQGAHYPRRAPYSMSPSRPLPFPADRAVPRAQLRPDYIRQARAMAAQHPFAENPNSPGAKCAKRKTQTSYAECVAREVKKMAKETWVKCTKVGQSIQQQKGLSRNKKKGLKRAMVSKCLRVGR